MGSPALGSETARKSTKGTRKELTRQMSDSVSSIDKSEAALDDGLRYILTRFEEEAIIMKIFKKKNV